MAREPGLTKERRTFLEKALKHYQDFAQDDDANVEVRFKTTQAYYFAGVIQDQLGRHKEAEAAFRKQASLLRHLTVDFPEEPRYRFDLFHSLSRRAGSLIALGLPDETLATQLEALGVIEALALDMPGEPNYSDAVANLDIQIGNMLISRGNLADAESLARRGLKVARDLTLTYPNQQAMPFYGLNVARAFVLLGRIKTSAKQFEEAEEHFLHAMETGQDLVDHHPEDPWLLFELVEQLRNLAAARARLGKFDQEGETLLVNAVKAQDRLAKDFSDLPRHVGDSAEAHRELGYYLLAAGKRAQAIESLQMSASIQERFIQKFPDNDWQRDRYAGFLAFAPKPVRNPKRSIALIEEIQRSGDPTRGESILVAALFGLGDWRGSVNAYEKLTIKGGAEDAAITLFAAMSYQQLGDVHRASSLYEQALKRAGDNHDMEMRQILAEARSQLEIPSKPK